MSERKNINNLFQEKFENHEIIPDEMVWENIELKLKEKKEKRRVIPFWWKLSGIAAALLIGFFVYNINSNPSIVIDNGVVNQDGDSLKTNKRSKIEVVTTNKNVEKSNTNLKSNNTIITTNTTSNEEKIVNSNNENSENAINSRIKNNSVAFEKNKPSNEDVVNLEKNKTNKNYNKLHNPSPSENNTSEEKIVYETSKNKKTKNNNALANNESITKENKSTNKNAIQLPNDNTLANKESTAKENKTTIENNNVINSNSGKEANVAITNSLNSPGKNKSVLNPNIKTDDTTNKKIDSTKIAAVEPNALEELQKEKEKKTITEPKLNRWQVSSNVAPIYFSSTSNGSPLDSELKDNNKVYSANNVSYGLGVNYAVNKRLKVRTGINLLNVDYDTDGILYYQNPSVNSKLTNLNPNVPGSLLVIETLSNVNTTFGKPIQKFEGSINQKLGYIEMPLEVTYKVLDKKFGIDFIGGMSTMILNRNEIYLQSPELSLKIGEANNLNNVHFSGNVGLGFKYGFLKNIEARIEPVFKYQINTFSNDAGNFKPFVFGVYSGINFSF
ncbi:MAG: hypothetical protein K2P85_02450 [Flavobacteriaceae bacterium]|nr:hypothetical protein [Flavobacteriaceae bacterium]